jgi:hypothetical protein
VCEGVRVSLSAAPGVANVHVGAVGRGTTNGRMQAVLKMLNGNTLCQSNEVDKMFVFGL